MNEPGREAREALHGEQYVRKFINARQSVRLARLAERMMLPAGANVLDVGCGTGFLASLLASRYGTYTGVDFSQAMVQEARVQAGAQGLRNCRFLCGDAVDVMRAGAEAYHAIFMLDISEHVPDQEWIGIVAAAWQALKPGGRVYLHTPNLDFFVEQLKQWGWMRQFPEHIAVRNAESNMQFFRAAGFKSVVCWALPHYNVLRFLHPLAGLPAVGKYMAARLWVVAIK